MPPELPYQGCLDRPIGRELVGWVHDPARPGHRLQVSLWLDGGLLHRRVASSFRKDLKQAGLGDGCHAFSVELPASVFDGAVHRLAMSIDGDTFESYEYRSMYTGSIDAVEAQWVRIRIADQTRPLTLIEAELYADGRFVTAGFVPELRLPRGFEIARAQRLELRARGVDQAIGEWVPTPLAPSCSFLPVNPPPDLPVYVLVAAVHLGSGITAVLRTLESLAAASNETASVVCVQTDQPEALEEARSRLGFGFDAAVPAGRFDTVHLEAGALVYANWLDRLRAAAYADANIATASPLTSGPIDGYSARELDQLAERTQRERVAVVFRPSTVCQYRRADPSGEVHVLAGGVRVESFGATALPEERHVDAHRLRRGIEELGLGRSAVAKVQQDGLSILVEGLRYCLPEDVDALRRVLQTPNRLTIDSALAPLDVGLLSYEVEVKDYGWICPRGDLIDETGRYCGEPTLQACERCLRKLGPRDGWGALLHRCGSVAELREQSRHLLESAAVVHFPSQDAADRLGRYVSIRNAVVRKTNSGAPTARPSLRTGEALRIARIGPATAIWDACILDARKRELPLDFVSSSCAETHAEWLSSEAPPLGAPEFSRFPIQFDIGVVVPGALRIPCGLPASRISDLFLREFGMRESGA